MCTALLMVLMAWSPARSCIQPGGDCSDMNHYNQYMAQVTADCCNGFGQEGNCESGVPDACDDRCYCSFIPFWTDCKHLIQTDPHLSSTSIRGLFEGVYGLCVAAKADNTVHDTDPVTPGDQFDPDAPLTASVHCHQQALTTASELSSNTGPMDGLWMVGVNGDKSCLYTPEGRQDPSQCEVMQNQQRLWDALEQRFGDCMLGPNATVPGDGGGHRRRRAQRPDTIDGEPVTMICDFSLDTNQDGSVGNGDDLWHGGMFGAIFSKDAVYFAVTNAVTAPLVKYMECDEIVGGG
jgi:hypothetical protein